MVFFFKQKTAYEMRISDWSSDVCSSDLSQVAQRRAAVQNAELDVQYTVIRAPVDGVVLSRTVEPGQTVAASFQTPVLFSIAEDLSKMQIGRASCRERVCQYV